MAFTMHTAAERPDLWERGLDSATVWPEYNLHGDVLNQWWRYLDEEPEGKRRQEALDALAALQPQLAKLQDTAGTTAVPGAAPSGTRILVLCEVPQARISVDGAEPAPSPLIREVTPGRHEVVVRAPGHRDAVRQVLANGLTLLGIRAPDRM